MRVDTHAAILAACRHLMTPLIRLLLRYGIGHREFSEVCKSVFVDVASRDYGIRGRPANLSKVAVLTGLSRKETKRVRDKLGSDAGQLSSEGLNPPFSVLRGWYSDPLFLNAKGTPVALGLDGKSPNLADLVRRYAGDVPVGAVVQQMERIGLIGRNASGRFRPLGNHFIPPNLDGQKFAAGATSIHNLISTISHNASPSSPTPWFERYAWSNYLPDNRVERLKDLVADKGQAFLEVVDDWIKKNEQPVLFTEGKKPRTEVGVGVYFFNVPKID
jgi:hypothetical protein